MNEVNLDKHWFIRVVYHGKHDESAAEEVFEQIMAFTKTLEIENKPINILADVRDMGSHTEGSRRTGQKIRDVIPFKKMAIIISIKDPYTAKISKIMSSMSKRKKEIGYFKTEKSAVKWLSK